MPNFVQLYRSTDTGAPVLSGTAGAMIALLDACLVAGYGTASVTSVVEAGTVYTVTMGTQNLEAGNYITLAGGSPSGINGTWLCASVPDSTHATFTGPGGLGTITGSITWRKAGLGWTKPYTATNRAAFRMASVTGRTQQHYLRIEEDGNSAGGQKECVATGAESMSDVNTISAQFPTSAQLAISGTASKAGVCWRKSTTADATARPWWLVGDGATFYFYVNSDALTTQGRTLCGFGGLLSNKAGDAYHTFIAGNGLYNNNPAVSNCGLNSTMGYGNATPNSVGTYLARASSQAGGSIVAQTMYTAGYASGVNYTLGKGAAEFSGIPYPDPVSGALLVQPLNLSEASANIRGRLPGLYTHIHSTIPCSENDRITPITGLSGITLLMFSIQSNASPGCALMDIFGPWQ